jgi:hypothetical protein
VKFIPGSFSNTKLLIRRGKGYSHYHISLLRSKECFIGKHRVISRTSYKSILKTKPMAKKKATKKKATKKKAASKRKR